MSIELALAAPSSSSSPAGGNMPRPLPPGFRFHPTDEELVLHYLRNRAAAAPCPAPVVADVDIYKFDPWDLPGKAVFGDAEWYFFTPRDRKYPNGVRPNRAAGSGYWKATGTDKPIITCRRSFTAAGDDDGAVVGVKKALVFYRGRPPKGVKTSWVMHEYRLADALNPAANNTFFRAAMRFQNPSSSSMRLDDLVLCRIYKKTNPQLTMMYSSSSPPLDDAGEPSTDDGHIGYGHQQDDSTSAAAADHVAEGSRLPRAPSVSDYLVDFSAVSEMFETMPASQQLGGATDAGSSGSGAAAAAAQFLVASSEHAGGSSSSVAQQSSHKKRSVEDYSNDSASDLEIMLHASNKRVMNDHTTASMAATVDSSFSVFGPAGYPSLQDRI